jgi:hypothetical protein
VLAAVAALAVFPQEVAPAVAAEEAVTVMEEAEKRTLVVAVVEHVTAVACTLRGMLLEVRA